MDELVLTTLGTVSPYPKDNKNCPGYLLEYNNQKILLDCGNGCTRLMNFEKDLNNLKVFISHLHPDHYGDLIGLLQAIYVYKKYNLIDRNPVVYVPNDIDSIDYKYIMKYAETADVEVVSHDGLNVEFEGITIETIQVPHQVQSYAFKVKTPAGTVVYSGDTGSKNNLGEFAKDCDLFICEATFLKNQVKKEDTHLYTYEAAEIAKSANVKKLLLTHFWPETDKKIYLEEAKGVFGNTEILEEGKKLVLRR